MKILIGVVLQILSIILISSYNYFGLWSNISISMMGIGIALWSFSYFLLFDLNRNPKDSK